MKSGIERARERDRVKASIRIMRKLEAENRLGYELDDKEIPEPGDFDYTSFEIANALYEAKKMKYCPLCQCEILRERKMQQCRLCETWVCEHCIEYSQHEHSWGKPECSCDRFCAKQQDKKDEAV